MHVSVAMCTYNGEKYLQEQLESILQQSRQPDELVVCDDASTDATLNFLQSFRRLAPFDVRIYTNDSNLGYVKNFEKAISKCNGGIILCSDQDDIWYRNRVERSVAVLRNNPECGYVFSDANLIDADGRLIQDMLWKKIKFTPGRWRIFQDTEAQAAVLFPFNCVTGATLAFKAEFRGKLFPIPLLNTVIHDGWVAIILSLYGKYGIALKEPLIYYRIHPQQQLGFRGKSVSQGLPKRIDAHRARIKGDISDFSTIRLHIEKFGNPNITERFEHAIGRLVGHLESQNRSLGLPSGPRRVIPVLKLYQNGGYAHYPLPFLSALKDIIY